MCADAVEVLQRQITDNSLESVYLFFPDPWHKKRHHKRRQVQAEWAQLIRSKLKIGGYLHMATDWQEYAEAIEEEVKKVNELKVMPTEQARVFIQQRANTKYERRGQRLGHQVFDLVYGVHISLTCGDGV